MTAAAAMVNSLSSFSSVFSALLAIALSTLLLLALKIHASNPLLASRKLKRQGIPVFPYLPFFGNSLHIKRLHLQARLQPLASPHNHAILSRVQPFYNYAMLQYGKRFAFWLGPLPRMLITDPNDVKEILSSRFINFKKSATSIRFLHRIFGDGLLCADGEDWEHQRHVLNPAFFSDKLKTMVSDMYACSLELVKLWEKRVEENAGSAEVEVCHDFMDTTASILARTCFGSSFEKGKAVFENQRLLAQLLTGDLMANMMIPGYRYVVPTSTNRKCWKLERSIENDLREIVEARQNEVQIRHSSSFGLDLLGLTLAQNEVGQADTKMASAGARLTTQQIMDECKTFFFAGHETTANLLTWTVLLLSLHPEWQERAREEVLEVCGTADVDQPIKPEHLNKLKIMGMVLNESLRLYPPALELSSRVPTSSPNSGKVGGVELPPNTLLNISILAIHRDKELWGEDAEEFKPERFTEGVWKACKHPQGFLPFAMGPRNCIGQSFAMMEAKVVMIVLLQRFQLQLSPNYIHAPISHITLTPQHGMQIILSPLRVN